MIPLSGVFAVMVGEVLFSGVAHRRKKDLFVTM
jgi:hypothetical protein